MATTSAAVRHLDFELPISSSEEPQLQTKLGETPKETALLGGVAPTRTEGASRRRAYDFFVEASPRVLEPQPAPGVAVGAAVVHGTVLEGRSESMLCELKLQAGIHRVRLPGALFPEGTVYGSPFTLRLFEDDGIRKPVIELRQVEYNEARAAEDLRVAAIIADLERL